MPVQVQTQVARHLAFQLLLQPLEAVSDGVGGPRFSLAVAEQRTFRVLLRELSGQLRESRGQEHDPGSPGLRPRLVLLFGKDPSRFRCVVVPCFDAAEFLRSHTGELSCDQELTELVVTDRTQDERFLLTTERRVPPGRGGPLDVGQGAPIDGALLLGPVQRALHGGDRRPAAAGPPARVGVQPLDYDDRLDRRQRYRVGNVADEGLQVAVVPPVRAGREVLFGPLAEHGEQFNNEGVVAQLPRRCAVGHQLVPTAVGPGLVAGAQIDLLARDRNEPSAALAEPRFGIAISH